MRSLIRACLLMALASSSVAFAQTSTAPNPATNFRSGGTLCPNAANTPGGADGQGGCFPGPYTVGPPAGTTFTTYTGSCTITTANTVIDRKDINCDVSIEANNVTIKNSRIYGTVSNAEGSGYAFTIMDSYIRARPPGSAAAYENVKSVQGEYFTILRSELTRATGIVYCWQHCTIKDSYLHVVNLDDPNSTDHASVLRIHNYTTVQHNTLHCDYTGPFNNPDIGCSADMTMYPQFAAVHHNTIKNNLFVANEVGNAYCAYGGNSALGHENDAENGTYITWDDNVFQRGTPSTGICGDFGPIGDYPPLPDKTGSHWTNNKFDDGTAIDPRAY